MYFSLNKHFNAVIFIVFSSVISLFVPASMASEEVMHIHFQLDKYTQPIANLKIDGKDEKFLIDIGSPDALHLSEKMMSEIPGLVIAPEKARSTNTIGQVFLKDKFNIPQLSINGMIFKDISGVSFTPWAVNLSQDGNHQTDNSSLASMVIGLDLFKGKAVLIDYKGQRLSVSDHLQGLGVNVSDGWIKLPLRDTQEGLAVKVSHNANSYNMILDTGASSSFFWKERLKSSPVNLSCKVMFKHADNDECEVSAFQFDEEGARGVKLNAVLFDGKSVQLNADGLIGNNFFSEYAVLIDFSGKKLFIKHNSQG
ncbi:retropepsin-like domain-containing protein [Xenorhabdus sp. Sc-CR9]|uniref:retropepsin-like domain-containing protein n=1 Tax=Xenorhabdus sp. Sc-CR9 TaxID=2584468 RepID=UPI001F401C7B|nr:retropepsin-like domain-containing protein [Xenorhabdus sp. Sc-CR9]